MHRMRYAPNALPVFGDLAGRGRSYSRSRFTRAHTRTRCTRPNARSYAPTRARDKEKSKILQIKGSENGGENEREKNFFENVIEMSDDVSPHRGAAPMA